MGASPVLLAAFLYPLGNQLVWEAKHLRKGLPRVDAGLLEKAFAKVFLLFLGSLPRLTQLIGMLVACAGLVAFVRLEHH
jgi:hypothetical protein